MRNRWALSRDAWGNLYLIVLALLFYVVSLRIFSGRFGPDVSPYKPLTYALIATGMITTLFWATVYVLRRGRKR